MKLRRVHWKKQKIKNIAGYSISGLIALITGVLIGTIFSLMKLLIQLPSIDTPDKIIGCIILSTIAIIMYLMATQFSYNIRNRITGKYAAKKRAAKKREERRKELLRLETEEELALMNGVKVYEEISIHDFV